MASFACTIERITSISPLLPRPSQPALSEADVSPHSLPFLSFSPSTTHVRACLTCALVIRPSSQRSRALFTLMRITITLVRVHTSSPMSRWSADNDGATVIRRTGDCCRQSGTIRSGPVQAGDHQTNRTVCIPRVDANTRPKRDTSVRAPGTNGNAGDVITIEKYYTCDLQLKL